MESIPRVTVGQTAAVVGLLILLLLLFGIVVGHVALSFLLACGFVDTFVCVVDLIVADPLSN